MSVLSKEIKQYMSGLTVPADDKFTARFIFPAEFTGFQGHFPGNPILPGVCMIQAVIIMFKEFEKKITLKEILQAKFFLPVSCNKELFFQCTRFAKKENEYLIKTLITSSDKTIAKLELYFERNNNCATQKGRIF